MQRQVAAKQGAEHDYTKVHGLHFQMGTDLPGV